MGPISNTIETIENLREKKSRICGQTVEKHFLISISKNFSFIYLFVFIFTNVKKILVHINVMSKLQ